MNSVQPAVTLGGYRANVTAWDDGSIMVEVGGAGPGRVQDRDGGTGAGGD